MLHDTMEGRHICLLCGEELEWVDCGCDDQEVGCGVCDGKAGWWDCPNTYREDHQSWQAGQM